MHCTPINSKGVKHLFNSFSDNGEFKKPKWTEGKIRKYGTRSESNDQHSKPTKPPRGNRHDEGRDKSRDKRSPSQSVILTINWCVGLCLSVIIVVALVVVKWDGRYKTSRLTLHRRKKMK